MDLDSRLIGRLAFPVRWAKDGTLAISRGTAIVDVSRPWSIPKVGLVTKLKGFDVVPSHLLRCDLSPSHRLRDIIDCQRDLDHKLGVERLKVLGELVKVRSDERKVDELEVVKLGRGDDGDASEARFVVSIVAEFISVSAADHVVGETGDVTHADVPPILITGCPPIRLVISSIRARVNWLGEESSALAAPEVSYVLAVEPEATHSEHIAQMKQSRKQKPERLDL